MSISGLVVRALPKNADRIAETLSLMDGVEVHDITKEGRLVVTVDNPSDGAAADIFSKFQNIEGVLNASLAYTHFDQD